MNIGIALIDMEEFAEIFTELLHTVRWTNSEKEFKIANMAARGGLQDMINVGAITEDTAHRIGSMFLAAIKENKKDKEVLVETMIFLFPEIEDILNQKGDENATGTKH